MSAAVSQEVLAPLRRVLRWQLSLRDAEGRIVCPAHRVEHTGKSAYAAVLALELARLDPEADRDSLVSAAVQQGRRLVANLVREGVSPCHTFRPGRHDPFNCSNSVIDGGACSDALAHIVRMLGPDLDAADRDAFTAASLLHARTYLRYAVLDKGIPAQRAWGLTGLVGANSLEPDEELERAAVEAVGILEAVQNADGSYPYHPVDWGAEHVGASDVSAYYQSRVTGFLLHALEGLGRDPTDTIFRAPLRRGLDLLLALQGPDGLKCGLVEAKPWYWGAAHEVASNPFDVLALATGRRVYKEPRYGAGAVRAFRAWAAHVGESGEPASHHPGPGRGRSYQCPVFWAAHAAWIARVAEDLTRCLAEEEPPMPDGDDIDLSVTWFPNVSLARVEDGRVIAWIRGARPGVNVHHGSPHGAGLLRCVRRVDAADLLTRCRLGGHQEGEWTASRGLPSLARGLRSGASAVRFSLWLARVHARAGRGSDAALEPLRTFRRGVLAFGHSRVGSPFALSPTVEVHHDGVVLRSGLAWRDGTPVPGSVLERTYRIDGQGLEVHERMLADGGVRGLRYQVPAAAVEARSQPGEIRFRLA